VLYAFACEPLCSADPRLKTTGPAHRLRNLLAGLGDVSAIHRLRGGARRGVRRLRPLRRLDDRSAGRRIPRRRVVVGRPVAHSSPFPIHLHRVVFVVVTEQHIHTLVSGHSVARCGSVAQWLGRWTCDWRSRVQSQPLHCRVQLWTSCSHTLSSVSGVTTLWRYI